MLAWRNNGLSVLKAVRVRAHDTDGRKKLAQYMLGVPLSLEKMSYDARSGMVIYRPHLRKGLKRNFQLMPGTQWLERPFRHIPDRFEHLVRYFGWYFNRVRATRARTEDQSPMEQETQDRNAVAARTRLSWARLIHKVYKVDPLQCPGCQGPTRVIALIEEAEVIPRWTTICYPTSPNIHWENASEPPGRGQTHCGAGVIVVDCQQLINKPFEIPLWRRTLE